MVKKIIRFLLLADFIWSVPLAFISFVAFGVFGEWFFGEGFASYDPSFVQAIVYTSLTIVSFNAITLMGLWFNFRTVYNYYIYESKKEYKELSPIYKLGILLFLYVFVMSLCFVVWRGLV